MLQEWAAQTLGISEPGAVLRHQTDKKPYPARYCKEGPLNECSDAFLMVHVGFYIPRDGHDTIAIPDKQPCTEAVVAADFLQLKGRITITRPSYLF